MNAPSKLPKNLPLLIMYWLPRLAYLQLLWFLSVLPCLTLVTATRTLIDSLIYCQGQEVSMHELKQVYGRSFLFYWHKKGKLDRVYNLYLLLLLIDSAILGHLQTGVGAILFYALLWLIWLGILFAIHQALLRKGNYPESGFLYILYLLGKHPLQLLLHLMVPFVIFTILFFTGKGYLFLIGVSGFFWLNIQIAKRHLALYLS